MVARAVLDLRLVQGNDAHDNSVGIHLNHPTTAGLPESDWPPQPFGPVVVADNVQLKYTFSANDVAFQKLSLALRYAKEAVENPDDYSRIMDIARQLAKESLEGVRKLTADNTVNDALLSATTLSHQTTINANVSDSDKIEAVDPNEVAAKLQSVETILQASFGVYAQISKLSLVNFIA